jgi:hypothetical protein
VARIRTIKPEFCSSADAGALSREARLFFLQLLTEADDEGRLLWLPRRLCGVLYPFDEDVGGQELEAWAGECAARRMVTLYLVDGVRYLQITNWNKHQRINRPTASKLPHPPGMSVPVPITDASAKAHGGISEGSRGEEEGEQGREGEQEEAESADADLPPAAPSGRTLTLVPEPESRKPCPQQRIVALYHECLPELRRVREWNETRQRLLARRWAEDPERQDVEWWRGFFGYVRRSGFLMGRVTGRDGRAFDCDLEWLVRPTNFAKVVEGKYEDAA